MTDRGQIRGSGVPPEYPDPGTLEAGEFRETLSKGPPPTLHQDRPSASLDRRVDQRLIIRWSGPGEIGTRIQRLRGTRIQMVTVKEVQRKRHPSNMVWRDKRGHHRGCCLTWLDSEAVAIELS